MSDDASDLTRLRAENARLHAEAQRWDAVAWTYMRERDELRRLVLALAERVADQSELLSKRAEK